MRPLYEIDQEILNCVDQETGEIIDPEALNALHMEREKKLEGKALTARKKVAENKIERLKAWLAEALEGEIFKTGKVRISYTHSTKLNIIDEQSVVNYIQTSCAEPEQFLRYQLPEIRKDAVKAAMKEGAEVPGAILEQTESVVIK